MCIVTVWTNSSQAVKLVQLSDDPADGTTQEQIVYFSTLPFLAGFSCVSEDYQGTAPETDPALWRWSNEQIIATVPVPASVTPRQVRLLLLSQNLLDRVEAMIAQQDEATRITWEYASEFRRDDPLLLALAGNLGLTEEQIDQFFIAAAQI